MNNSWNAKADCKEYDKQSQDILRISHDNSITTEVGLHSANKQYEFQNIWFKYV